MKGRHIIIRLIPVSPHEARRWIRKRPDMVQAHCTRVLRRVANAQRHAVGRWSRAPAVQVYDSVMYDWSDIDYAEAIQ